MTDDLRWLYTDMLILDATAKVQKQGRFVYINVYTDDYIAWYKIGKGKIILYWP